MIEADIAGKLGQNCLNAHERSEDLLTSTVFGLLRYLPTDRSMLPLLKRARPVQLVGEGEIVVESAIDAWLPLDVAKSCEIRFWPWFDRFGEPDLLLLIKDELQRLIYIVMIEAKLHSGKSGDADADDEEEDELAWHPDQLVRYWRGLKASNAFPQDVPHTLIYLTAHSTPPLDELASSLERCPSMRLGWLSWHDVWQVVAPIARRSDAPPAAIDLERLLAHRGFKALESFRQTVPMVWQSQRFWRSGSWFISRSIPSVSSENHFWRSK